MKLLVEPDQVKVPNAHVGDYYLLRNCTMRLVQVIPVADRPGCNIASVYALRFKTLGKPSEGENSYFEGVFMPDVTLARALRVEEAFRVGG